MRGRGVGAGLTTSDPFLGTVFGGRWLIERPLMSGGMGSVYVAKHGDTGRPVALKVIKSGSAEDPDFVGRFRRETDALAAVSHPNVVGFLDSGIDNGNIYLVMELLVGRPLRAIMREPVEWRRAFRIAADTCRALAAVHKLGIIHRDLKPENVFLQDSEGHDEFAKLIDFGIARLHEAQTTTATQTGVIVGTPGYISPEQLRGRAATPASDVYAVGVILYELVTSVAPFGCADTQQMLVRQLVDPVVPPITHAPSLPAHANAAILRLMEREPSARVQTAKEALALLIEVARDAIPPTGLTSSQPTEGALVVERGTLLQHGAAIEPPVTTPTPAQVAPLASATTPLGSIASAPIASAPSTSAPSTGASIANTPVTSAPATNAPVHASTEIVRRPKARWGRRLAIAAALAIVGVVVTWIAFEGARFPRDRRDVVTVYRRTIAPAFLSMARVVRASADAGARTAQAEARRRETPPPTAAAIDALVRGFAGELVLCGGDTRPRIVRVNVHPSGRIDAVTAPDDAAARCLTGSARRWRVPAFDGATITVDVPGIRLGTRAP